MDSSGRRLNRLPAFFCLVLAGATALLQAQQPAGEIALWSQTLPGPRCRPRGRCGICRAGRQRLLTRMRKAPIDFAICRMGATGWK
jgi:hypothetical protein